MPPKVTEQHKRDKSSDQGKIGEKNKDRKNSNDESAMEKLKDKVGGLFHGDRDDDKNEKSESRKDEKKDDKGRQRSKSRSRSREKQQGRNKSPERKGPGAGPGPGQRRGSRSRSRERQQGRNQSPGRQGPGSANKNNQQPMKMAGAGAAGAGAAAGHHDQGQGQGQGQGQNAQRQHASQQGTAGGNANQRARTKRGLCWPRENTNEDPERFTRPGSKVSWYYNWSPHQTKAAEDLQFVPMQWNAGGIKELSDNVKRTDAKAVMAFNEPELKDQANMSAEDAAEQWMKHVEPLRKQGVRCGSPGISNAGHAVQWMQDFWGRIKKQGSDVDFWCFHWYGPDLGPFYDYIWSTHNQLDPSKKAWITEFACTNWDKQNPLPKEQVENFARESFKYLDTLDWVERYCWFAPTKDIKNVGEWAAMYNDQGNLTEVGKIFRGD